MNGSRSKYRRSCGHANVVLRKRYLQDCEGLYSAVRGRRSSIYGMTPLLDERITESWKKWNRYVNLGWYTEKSWTRPMHHYCVFKNWDRMFYAESAILLPTLLVFVSKLRWLRLFRVLPNHLSLTVFIIWTYGPNVTNRKISLAEKRSPDKYLLLPLEIF